MVKNLKNGVGAQGFDVTEFFDDNAVKGDPETATMFDGVNYYFSSESNKSKFMGSPLKFTPQYGGYCAIAMSEGKQFNPNPKSFRIQHGKLYLFTKMMFGIIDAQRQWNKDPEGKQQLADAAYAKMN